jgi:hypothetical protein
MNRARAILGIFVGVLLILGACAHSLLGWQRIGRELASAQSPADLTAGVGVVWHFAGASMVAFGLIVILVFLQAMKNASTSLVPPIITALLFLFSGAYSLYLSHLKPFFWSFVVLGLLLLVASWPTKRPG